jgi:DNA-binding transcriptional ArsR family regulator
MNIQDMEDNSEQAALLMGMLSNPKRLMILCQLLDGEKSVMSLVEAIGISQSALSQHLAKLRAAGLVATRRDAQTIFYRSAGREAVAVLELLNSLYCAADADQCAVES